MNKRNEKAITLIALVVTIVVLLILAGVSISMLTGDNGIITQAQNSKNKNEQGEIEEQVRLALMAAKTAGLGKIDIPTLNSELKDIGYAGKIESFPATITIDGVTVTIDEKGNVDEEPTGDTSGDTENDEPETIPAGVPGQTYETETKVSIGTDEVIIPGGATISGINGEYENVDDGLVIYIIPEGEEVNDWNTDSNGIQKTYDQFIWVPVPHPIATDINEDGTINAKDIDDMIAIEQYPMAIETGTTTDDEGNTVTNYRGVSYVFTESTDDEGSVTVSITDRDWSSTSTGFREPAMLSSYDTDTTYNNGLFSEETLQTEFNKMVEKVSKNKGFWVGRYETSNMSASSANDSTQQITVIKGTTTGINKVNWYRMYAQQKNYSNLANITSTSSMIWGSQWDQIMIWMKDVDNESQNSKYILNSLKMGNLGKNDSDLSTTEPAKTGNSENYKVKNIYDLAGNVNDRTLEAYSSNYRLVRRKRLQ